MVFKLDAGPVIASQQIAIEQNDTTPSLRGKLIPIGADLVADLLDDVTSGKSEAFARLYLNKWLCSIFKNVFGNLLWSWIVIAFCIF